MKRFDAALLTILALGASAAPERPVAEMRAEFLRWRYGMFIHFGMATFTEREWANGHEDPAAVAPGRLDCGQWADAAREAGMRYAVLTTKHTDGWALWDSRPTGHDITAFKNFDGGRRDLVREFVDAFRARGIKIGLYYCFPGDYANRHGNTLPPDKPNLHGLPPEAKGDYTGFIKKQLAELLTGYGPIDLLWIDQYRNKYTNADWPEIKAFIHSLQPNCLVMANNSKNERDTDLHGYEYPWLKKARPGTELPPADNPHPAEVCDTLTGTDWFWKTSHDESSIKSAKDIADMVALCNARRANYLLNVPPDAAGLIPEIFVARLREAARLIDAAGAAPDGGADLLAGPLEPAETGGWMHFSETPGTPVSNVWTLADGVLFCRGSPRGYLAWAEELADFTLRLEWRRPEGVKPGKAGVLIRTTGPDKIWPRSLEAQLNAGQAGDFWGLDGFALDGPADRKSTVDHEQFGRLTNLKKTTDAEKPVGEWNLYEIEARGPVVVLRINGAEVNRTTACDTRAGRICLTAEGDEIHFRNIRLFRAAVEAPDFTRMIPEVFPRSAVYRQEGYCLWDPCIVRSDDGDYHLLYSRWPVSLGFNAWCTHAEIAWATSARASGPYEFRGVVLPARGADFWDGHSTYNTCVISHGGKFYLYYTGNRGTEAWTPDRPIPASSDAWWVQRNNQRIGVAVADHPGGPWRRMDAPLIDVGPGFGQGIVAVPNVVAKPGGGFRLYYKTLAEGPGRFGGGVFHYGADSDDPLGPFVRHPEPMVDKNRLLNDAGKRFNFHIDDHFEWIQDGRWYAIVKDHDAPFLTPHGRSLLLFESSDGRSWHPSRHSLAKDFSIAWDDGTAQDFERLEMPKLLLDGGRPTVLSLAARARGTPDSFLILVPLAGGKEQES